MWKQYVSLPRSVHILCLGTFINRAGTFVVVFLTLYLKSKLDLDVTFATRAMGIFGLGAIVASLVGGQLADQIGRRTVMLTSLFGGGVILVVFSFITTPWAIMLMVFLFALVAEMYRPAASAMIADLTDPAERPHAFGLMYVSINLGFTVGAFVGGKIADYDFQWLFWGDALTAAIYGLIIAAAIRETLPSRQSAAASSHDEVAGGHEAGPSKDTHARLHLVKARDQTEPATVPLLAAARHIITDYPFMVFCLGTLLIGLVFMQAMSTFPLYLEQLGFSADDYGSVIALNGLLIVCLQLPLTTLLSRRHRGMVVVAGAIVLSIGFGLIGVAGPTATIWQFAFTVIIWTMGEIMMAPFVPAIVSDLAPTRLRARYMGVSNTAFSSGGMLGPPIGGEILGHPKLGGPYLWTGTFLVAMVGALLFFSVRRQIAEKRN